MLVMTISARAILHVAKERALIDFGSNIAIGTIEALRTEGQWPHAIESMT
jgi:hypothetical protein